MVMHQPSKLCMSVRFRLPAPTEYFREIRELHAIVQHVVQVLARAIAQGIAGAAQRFPAGIAPIKSCAWGAAGMTRSFPPECYSFTVDGPGPSLYIGAFRSRAQMAELVDALRSGRSSRKGVEVRVLFWAPGSFLSASFSVRESLQNSI